MEIKVIIIKNISKVYSNNENMPLKNIDFNILDGEMLGIMGESGSGKTTLLNIISGIDKGTTGEVRYNDINVMKLNSNERAKFRRRNVGFIFQEYNLLDSLSIYDNIAIPRILNKEKLSQIHDDIFEIVNMLGIREILAKYPSELSGGQRQRVAIARSLIMRPQIIFADEPTGALDSENTRILLKCFQNMNEKLKCTVVIVTHDPMVASYCKRILFLSDGTITNEIFRREKEQRTFYNEILKRLKYSKWF